MQSIKTLEGEGEKGEIDACIAMNDYVDPHDMLILHYAPNSKGSLHFGNI